MLFVIQFINIGCFSQIKAMDLPAVITKQQTIKAVPYGEQLLGMSVSPALVLPGGLKPLSYIQIRFK